MTFVYLMLDGWLEEYNYTLLYEKTQNSSEVLVDKVETVLDFYNDNYLKNDSKVKFFYFNKSNLAVKFSPSVTRDMLNTDLRHFLNIIHEKFETNSKLEEYKITTNSHWIVGIKSLERILIIMMPLSLSLENMEIEKVRIVNRYFSQFIF